MDGMHSGKPPPRKPAGEDRPVGWFATAGIFAAFALPAAVFYAASDVVTFVVFVALFASVPLVVGAAEWATARVVQMVRAARR